MIRIAEFRAKQPLVELEVFYIYRSIKHTSPPRNMNITPRHTICDSHHSNANRKIKLYVNNIPSILRRNWHAKLEPTPIVRRLLVSGGKWVLKAPFHPNRLLIGMNRNHSCQLEGLRSKSVMKVDMQTTIAIRSLTGLKTTYAPNANPITILLVACSIEITERNM